MEMVCFPDGIEEPKLMITLLAIVIDELPQQGLPGLMAQYDIVKLVHDSTYRGGSHGIVVEILENAGLMKDGNIHDTVRRILRHCFALDETRVVLTPFYREIMGN